MDNDVITHHIASLHYRSENAGPPSEVIGTQALPGSARLIFPFALTRCMFLDVVRCGIRSVGFCDSKC